MRSFSLSQRNIFAHPLRSVLTISAIALGANEMIALDLMNDPASLLIHPGS